VFGPDGAGETRTRRCRGAPGSRWSLSRSSASISSGTRRVPRCSRAFTSSENASQA